MARNIVRSFLKWALPFLIVLALVSSGTSPWTLFPSVVADIQPFGSDREFSGSGTDTVTDKVSGAIASGLVGHWKLDESSGTSAGDSSEHANHGALFGSPVWTSAGQVGGALEWAANGDGVQIPNSPSLENLDPISIAMWFFADTIGESNKGKLIDREKSFKIGFTNSSSKLYVSFSRWNGASGKWRFTSDDGESLLGGWHHLVVTYDYSSTANDPMMYLDGVLVAEVREDQTPAGTPSSDTSPLVLGNDTDQDRTFDGRLDDVQIYNRVLSESEVVSLMEGSSDDTPPTAPSDLAATVDLAQVQLSWTAAEDPDTGIAAYNIYRDTASGTVKTWIDSVSGSNFSYIDNPPAGSDQHYYQVSAVNGVGLEGNKSNEAGALLDWPPGAPTGLVASAGDNQVSLDWVDNTESDLAGYNVYRSETAGGPYQQLNASGPVGSSSFLDDSATNGSQYFYVVTAEDSAGQESGFSNEDSALLADEPPAAPTGLTATAGDGQVSLDWADNTESDLAGYNVYRSETPSGPYQKLNTTGLVTVSNYLDTSVTNGVSYYYIVQAEDTLGQESASSTEVNAVPFDSVPAVPTALAAVAGDNQVSLNWNDNVEGNLAGYNVYRSQTSSGPYQKLNTIGVVV
ncbi:MAG: LamG-like jellyroll fold domain-containing protein, partial [Dehalococcoidia bacterium]